MNHNAIILVGPERGDKAIALQTVSDIDPEPRSYELPDGLDPKLPGSITMHRGLLRLKHKRAIELFNSPDDEPVDAVAGLCRQGGIGLIIVLNNKRPYPLRDMHFYLHTFADFIAEGTLALGITRMEPTDAFSIEDYHKVLIERELQAPVFEIAVDDYNDVIMLVQAVIFTSLARQSYSPTRAAE